MNLFHISRISSRIQNIIAKSGYLGEFEQFVLLAVLRLGKSSYGVPIRHEIEARTGRSLTVAALYSTLERLEQKGYGTSHYGDPTPERGGRSRPSAWPRRGISSIRLIASI